MTECKHCGADISRRHPNCRYCHACADARERQRSSKRAAARAKHRPGSCMHCGETALIYNHKKTGICAACRAARNGVTVAMPQQGGPAERRCLGCGEHFPSWGHGNRMCSGCRYRTASPFEPDALPHA